MAAAILCAAGGSVAAQATGNSTNVVDSVWTITDPNDLEGLPALFVLRPTQPGNARGAAGARIAMGLGEVKGEEDEDGNAAILAHNMSFAAVMAKAYAVESARVVCPPGAPTNGFDLLMSGRFATKERLQSEIKHQLGYTAHLQSRPTDVLLLTQQRVGGPGFAVSSGGARGVGMGGSMGPAGPSGTRSMSGRNHTIGSFIERLQTFFNKPILDRSGLTGTYDISIAFVWGNGISQSDALIQILPVETGLALTPAREPVDLLIVEPNVPN